MKLGFSYETQIISIEMMQINKKRHQKLRERQYWKGLLSMKISDISTLYKGRGSNYVTPSTFSYYHFYIRSLSFICQLHEKWSKATL